MSEMIELPKLDLREEHFRIPSDTPGLKLFLRHLAPAAQPTAPKIVLYVHGATFPSALSIAHRFDGYSWRDDLNAAGFDVWGLDFVGFGSSDRYQQMAEPPESQRPFGRAEESSRQIERATRFILARLRQQRLSIISHSWGSMPTGVFAGRHPELVERIVFFAPVAQRRTELNDVQTKTSFPAWRLVSLDEQWKRFVADVQAGERPVLSRSDFDEWGQRYLDTDAESRGRKPESVKIPNGPTQDIAEAFAEHLAYDPASVRTPVAIIRGEWDSVVTDADARWLFDALKNAPIKRDVKISRATHLMHLEESRFALYRETQAFLEGRDEGDRGSKSKASGCDEVPTQKPGEDSMTEQNSPQAASQITIAGYDYGRAGVAHSSVTLDELQALEASAGWNAEDAKTLQRHGQIFRDNAEHMVDAWRAVIASQPQLAKWFFGPDGKPDDAYKSKIKKRFVKWVLDACFRPHDQAWLDYQEEIGLRHTPAKKNQTDGAHTPPVVPMRYLVSFVTIVTISTRKFFVDCGVSGEELRTLEDAWAKTVQLHVTLWTRPYVKEGLW
jgi:pimeloyl-ACP methyl ester carboxylesterase